MTCWWSRSPSSEPRSEAPRSAGPFGFLAEPETEIHLGDYLRVVTDRWQLVAIIAMLTLALSLLQYAVTPREYRATALIQIDRRIGVSLKGIEDVWLDSFYNMEYYPTQYRLLTSRGLAERVVLNLRLDEDAGFNPGANAVAKPGAAADDAVVGGLAGQVLGGLEVNPLRNTQLVEVSYRSRSPELAARVANGVVDAYIDWGIETRTQVVGKASSFYAKQIETLKQEIQDKEAQLQAYSRRADIVSLDPATNVTLKRLEALNQDFISAMSERINKEARLNELLSASNDRATEILDDKLVADQRSELLEMEREYASKLNVYKPEWPAMVELKAKIEGARRNLVQVTAQALERSRESARADVQLAGRREQSLAAELNQAKAENRQLSTAAVEYNILQGEISTRRALLDELLRKQSETDVSSRLQATGESNVRVVDKALVPGGPFRPSLSRSLTMGLGIGFAAGIGLVFLLHYMDRTIKSSEEVERVLQLPVLSVVPDVSQEAKGAASSAGTATATATGTAMAPTATARAPTPSAAPRRAARAASRLAGATPTTRTSISSCCRTFGPDWRWPRPTARCAPLFCSPRRKSSRRSWSPRRCPARARLRPPATSRWCSRSSAGGCCWSTATCASRGCTRCSRSPTASAW